ncbi:phenylacetate--CoA ligase family protein [Streptomyces zingiberis]|uniref:Phenylacetate--CoA ligase family protein n=1 Tax=Streptomyces zingiberis TaxID=2053010 RepID=A0ABX1C0I8_9ACTN|nr:phenylacetate--CoA ligase family protein [Streptomyces zingiberis]NJQ01104.1 phenylacetate--CoA ligase family protein [Streptomyces zingiberis]
MFTVFNEELDRTARELRDRHQAFAAGEWSGEALTAHQLREFRRTVAYVKEKSPFYARHLASVDPGAIASTSPEHLAAVPFTTKDDLRREFENVLSLPPHEAWIFYETTGTTGRSTPCPRNNTDSLHNNTALTVYYDTIFRQFGDEQVIGVSGPTELHAFGDTFGDVCRNLGLAVAKMWPHSPMVGYGRALETLRVLPATGLFSTPGMALSLAKKAYAAGLHPRRDFRLDVLMCTGELASPSLLENIGEVWGATVHNALYASQEASVMGAAGADGALYTAPLLNLYEVIDPDTTRAVEPGPDGVRTGELVVTSLYQGSKPLVRYRTGDLVRLAPAAAGRTLPAPTLEVLGRTRDSLSIGTGRISGYDLEELLLAQPRGYLDYQIVIDAVDGRDELTLHFETPPDGEGVRVDEAAVAAAVRERLGVPVHFAYGPLGGVTTTGAMVSWKAARVEDRRRSVPDEERAAALAVAGGRAR